MSWKILADRLQTGVAVESGAFYQHDQAIASCAPGLLPRAAVCNPSSLHTYAATNLVPRGLPFGIRAKSEQQNVE